MSISGKGATSSPCSAARRLRGRSRRARSRPVPTIGYLGGTWARPRLDSNLDNFGDLRVPTKPIAPGVTLQLLDIDDFLKARQRPHSIASRLPASWRTEKKTLIQRRLNCRCFGFNSEHQPLRRLVPDTADLEGIAGSGNAERAG